jgi:hypothetical protein
MDRPVHFFLVLGAVLLGPVMAVGEESASAPTPQAEPATPPKHERAVSPHTAAVLAAGLPKFEAAKPAEKKTGTAQNPRSEDDKPANGIVRLPNYIVRESKLPTPLEVMTRKELENYAMNRYLGPADGFDRGFLNLFTIAQLWQKIPLIGRFVAAPFGSMTNEQRAMLMYEEDERRRKMNELMDLASVVKKSGDTKGADAIKSETQKTFLRHSDD